MQGNKHKNTNPLSKSGGERNAHRSRTMVEKAIFKTRRILMDARAVLAESDESHSDNEEEKKQQEL